ncbi:MAG: T9SS type A sorting domain-containing protein [Ekhidna sp.]
MGQTDRFVSSSGTDTGDCTNSLAPCATIQYAHDQSSTSSSITDVINVAAGAYSETNITINRNIHISGPDLPSTAVFSNGGGEQNRFAYVNGNSPSPDAIVSNISFLDYDANGFSGSKNGGVFRLGSSIGSLTINNCNFVNNAAVGGGAIYAFRGALTINNSHFEGNTVETRAGGAIWIPSSNVDHAVTINNSTFVSNSTIQDGGGVDDGGAISFRGLQLSITNSTFYGNTSGDNGGAINAHGLNTNSQIDLTNCLFYENNAEDLGGAIYLNDISSNIYHCTIADNNAETTATSIASNTAGGGIEYKENAVGYDVTINIINSLFWNNQAINGTNSGDRDIREGESNTATDIDVENCLYKVASFNQTRTSNNIANEDPLFQDGDNVDFSLRKYHFTVSESGDFSPAVDAGQDIGVSADILGRARYNDDSDIGAYEFQGEPLPVELVSFSAYFLESNGTVVLDWMTLSEVNNDFFTIERSRDGRVFVPIKRIDGMGNSNSLHKYHAVDDAPLSGRSYYRLKQTDFDGRTSYSEMKSVNVKFKSSIRFFPNPTHDHIKFLLSGNCHAEIHISLMNLSGEVLSHRVVQSPLGNSVLNFHLPEKTIAGVYIIHITGHDFAAEEILLRKKLVVR